MTILQIANAAALPFIGSLIKKYDSRIILSVALLIQVLSFVLKATAQNIIMIYIAAAISSFPLCVFMLLSIPILINNWFPMNTATMIGIVGCAQGLGGIIFNSIGGTIIQNYGWRNCFWFFAGITLIMLPITLFVIRTKPEDKGLEPYSTKKMQKTMSGQTISAIEMDKAEAMRTPMFWLIIIAMPIVCFLSTYSFYLNSYFRVVGMTAAVAGIISGVSQGGNMVFKIVIGRISDINIRGGAFWFISCTILCFILMLITSGTVAIVIAALLFGNVYAAVNLYGPAITKSCFGSKDFARLWATVSIFIQLIGAFGNTFWGYLIEETSYQTSFLIAIILLVAVLVIFNVILFLKKKYEPALNIQIQTKP